VQYVTEKFIFLGGAVPELTVCAVSAKLSDKTLDGLRKAKGLRVGASSARDTLQLPERLRVRFWGSMRNSLPATKG